MEKKKKEKYIYSLQPSHLEAEQNDRKVKRSKIKQKWVKIGYSHLPSLELWEQHVHIGLGISYLLIVWKPICQSCSLHVQMEKNNSYQSQ